MTRKDYIAIADALAQTTPYYLGDKQETEQLREARAQWECTRKAIADVLAADNPRFSRQRFYAATEKE